MPGQAHLHALQDFPPGDRSGITTVATIGPGHETRVDIDAVASRDMSKRETDVRGVERTCITIRFGHLDPAAHDERASLAARGRLRSRVAEHDHRSGDDGPSGAITGATADEEQSPSHPVAGVGAHGPVDHDVTARDST